jgi:type III secretion protein D
VTGGDVLARARRRWPLVALALALPVLVAAAWLAQPTRSARPALERVASTDAVRAWLTAEGFGHLRVQRGASGPLVVDGLVDRDSERVRIAAGLGAAGLSASLDLASGEQIARQVADVLRLNGVRAEVRHVGRGVVQARLHEPDAERRARAEAAARRDVRGLASLAVEVVDTGPVRPAAAVPVDPAKRVVTIVYGPGGYVVTADGARYFEGALLPSGHRIARIEARDVELVRDGRSSRLAL